MSRPNPDPSSETVELRTADPGSVDRVGPVLTRDPRSDAVVAAILELNESVEVIDRGAYLRLLAKGSVRVTRSAVEAHLKREFKLPEDLEELMPSFKGELVISEHEAVWRCWEKVS